jgi:hypothetical protein
LPTAPRAHATGGARLLRGCAGKLAHYTLKWLIIGGLLYWIFA